MRLCFLPHRSSTHVPLAHQIADAVGALVERELADGLLLAGARARIEHLGERRIEAVAQ